VTRLQKVLLIGLACGLGAAVLVRLAVALLLGGIRALIILMVLGVAWLAFRRPRAKRGSE
jgi:hypothetical protein